MLLNQDQDLLADLSIAICSSYPTKVYMGSDLWVLLSLTDHPVPYWKSNTNKKMNSLGGRKLLLTKFRKLLDSYFFGTYFASSALNFATPRQCRRMSVQSVEKLLHQDPNWQVLPTSIVTTSSFNINNV